MKRKLALLTCVAVMAVMLNACGGSSSGTAAPEPAAEETTTEAVVQEEVTEKVEEAAEEASTTVEEVAAAAETIAAAAETAAEAATEAAAAEDVQSGELGANQMSQQFAADSENITEMDAEKQAPITEVTEDADVEDKGFAFSNGEMYEYTAFRTASTADMEEYVIIYYEPVTNVLCSLLDVTHFSKSSGVTEYQLRNFDISTLFPGFYDMPFAKSMIYDYSDYYEFVVGFIDLDKIENVKIASDYGLLKLQNYMYGNRVDATSIVNQYRGLGYEEVSDYDLSKANITP